MRLLTPWPPGHSNCYLVLDGVKFLVDCGIYTHENLKFLTSEIKKHTESLDYLVVTHGHIDHWGNSGAIAETFKTQQIICHEEERTKLIHKPSDLIEKKSEGFMAFFSRHGVPPEVISQTKEILSALDGFSIPVHRGEGLFSFPPEIKGRNFSFLVEHTPGHSTGHIILFEKRKRVLISGDHLLIKKPPTPLVDTLGKGEKFNYLPQYIKSLKRFIKLQESLTLPGHWSHFNSPSKIVLKTLRFYESMCMKTLSLMDSLGKPLSAYQLSRAMYGDFPPQVFFIPVSETLGTLNLLYQLKLVKKINTKGNNLTMFIPCKRTKKLDMDLLS